MKLGLSMPIRVKWCSIVLQHCTDFIIGCSLLRLQAYTFVVVLLLITYYLSENGCYIRVKTTGPIRMKLYSDVDLGPLQC